MFSKDLGIDLGTMFTRLADSTQVLSEEPTIVAIEVADQKMVAVGQEARDMYGRVPESIEVARPLKNGVIADYEITETLLSYLLQEALARVTPEDHDTYLRMEAALRRSNLRLDVARRYRKSRDTYSDKDASM